MPERNRAVIKRGNIEDEQTHEAYEVFEFPTVTGKTRQVQIPRANSRNASHIYKELLKLNADLPLLQAPALALVQQAVDTEVSARLVYAKAMGWRRHLKGFTFANGFISGPGVQRGVLPPLWASGQRVAGLQCRGTLMGWRKAVAKPAAGSDSLVLMIAACFTAPLLKIVNQANFGLNLFGLVPEDRRAVVKLAASVFGIADEAPHAGATINGVPLVEYAHAFNDLAVVFGDDEELGSAASYRRWRQGIKALIIGRATPQPKAPGLTWRGIFFTTPQNSSEQLAASVGEVRTNDERAAWIDVPAGSCGLFAYSASDSAHRRQKRWARENRQGLLTACAAQQGTPIQAYITFLIERRVTLKRAIRKHTETFTAAAAEQRLGRRHPGIVRNLALMHAAGCLAIEAGILPWAQHSLQLALQRQLAAIFAHIRSYRVTPQAIRRILRHRLRSQAVVQLTRGMQFGPAQQAGFRRKVDGHTVFTVHAKAFRRWFGDAARCRAALLWLHKSGLLVLGDRHALPSAKSTEWAERTPRWPDGSVQRSFVFKAPGPGRRRVQRSIAVAMTENSRAVRQAPLMPVPLLEGPPIRMRRDVPPKPRGRPPLTKHNPGWEDHPDQLMPSYQASVGPPPWRDN